MKVYAVVVAENKAGLTSSFFADPDTIDWSPPVIENLQVELLQTGITEFTIAASWKTTDEESNVQDCYWTLGQNMIDVIKIIRNTF